MAMGSQAGDQSQIIFQSWDSFIWHARILTLSADHIGIHPSDFQILPAVYIAKFSDFIYRFIL